jgi:plastocyanin
LAILMVTVAMTMTPRQIAAQGAVHGQVRLIDRPGVGAGSLRDVVLYLESDRITPRPASLDKATVGMRQREFEPHVQIIGVGGSVGYPNQDPFSHNVFSNSALGAFDLGLYRSGKTRAATFNAAGVYAIYCNIHARMVNYVVAVRTPYVTRAQANGSFVLENVPAGTYTLHVWHERAMEHVEKLRVPPEGLHAVTLALDARGYSAKAHTNKFGQPYAATRADRY